MSDWDTYQRAAPNSRLADMAREYAELSQQAEQLEARLDLLKDHMLAEFSEESGEQVMIADNLEITVNRQERWTWDNDILEDIYGSSDDIPPHVKRKMTVDKRRFQALDDEDKRELLPALTRKPGAAKITIKETN
jgi:hypothetical protein